MMVGQETYPCVQRASKSIDVQHCVLSHKVSFHCLLSPTVLYPGEYLRQSEDTLPEEAPPPAPSPKRPPKQASRQPKGAVFFLNPPFSQTTCNIHDKTRHRCTTSATSYIGHLTCPNGQMAALHAHCAPGAPLGSCLCHLAEVWRFPASGQHGVHTDVHYAKSQVFAGAVFGGMFAWRATFLLTIPTSAPDLPSHGEAPQVDHVGLHTFPTKHVA